MLVVELISGALDVQTFLGWAFGCKRPFSEQRAAAGYIPFLQNDNFGAFFSSRDCCGQSPSTGADHYNVTLKIPVKSFS
jgi:hypothetical protein